MRGVVALVLLLTAAADAQVMSWGRKNGGGGNSFPSPHVTVLSSSPAAECDGSAITTDQGGAITFTRALAAYCEKADGSLTLVASGSPRVSNKGILIEGSRTNLIIRSHEFDNAAWAKTEIAVTTGQTDPAGGTQADLLNPSDGMEDSAYIESTAFVPNVTTGVFSIYTKGAGASVGQQAAAVVVDTTATIARSTCDGLTLTTGWQRFTCAASGMTAANNHVVRFFPDVFGHAETNVIVWGAQFEGAGSALVSSYIPTTTASVTRPVEVATFANGTDISATGCVSASVSFGNPTLNAGSSAAVMSNGTEQMLGYNTSTQAQANDGTNTISANVSSILGRTISMKSSWTGSVFTLVADGVTGTGTFDGSFSSTAAMRIGARTAAAGYSFATVKNIKVGAHPNSCD
jgi:hypothetical protein